MIKRIAWALLVVVLALAVYLTLWPVPIRAVAWKAPPAPGYTGPHAPNNRLAALTLIQLGAEAGPEHIVLARDGKLYAGMASGNIVRMNPDGSAQEVFVNTGGRVLGFDFDAAGRLIAADSVKGLLAIGPDRKVASLTDTVGGDPIRYADAVVVAMSGKIYFSDASGRFARAQWGGGFEAAVLDILEQACTGRILEYDPATNVTRILAKGFSFANGRATPDRRVMPPTWTAVFPSSSAGVDLDETQQLTGTHLTEASLLDSLPPLSLRHAIPEQSPVACIGGNMECVSCSHQNPKGATLCGNCGAPLPPRCPACGTAHPSAQKFCSECGRRLAPPTLDSEPPEAVSLTTPVSEIHPTEQHSGERRHLTVMFSDLVGSTSLADRLDPEDLTLVIRGYQDACTQIIARLGGTIAQYLGDGILVYFGYPQAHEDDPQRAVLAALHIVATVPAMTIETGSGSVRPECSGRDSFWCRRCWRCRSWLATRTSGPWEGPRTSPLAFRIWRLPNAVVISDETRRLIGDRFLCRTLGMRTVKGLVEPVPVFEVLGEAHPVTDLHAPASSSRGGLHRARAGTRYSARMLGTGWRRTRTGCLVGW